MSRFCCCAGANLRIGGIVVGILSLIGSSFLLAMSIVSIVWMRDREWELYNPNATDHFSNTTVEHWEDTLDLEYLYLTMIVVSVIVAALLIYGSIKRIRALLYAYIIWTIVVVLWSFGDLIYLVLDAPRFVIPLFIVNFFLLLATAIYFILVVYSYSELIRLGGECQAIPQQVTTGPTKEAPGDWGSKLQYARFENQQDDPGMGDDREVLTA